MSNTIKTCLSALALVLSTQICQAGDSLVVHPAGSLSALPHNDDYTVRVRVPNGDWKDLYEIRAQVDMDDVQNASFVQFDMAGSVEVMVKKNNGKVGDVAIRPLSRQVEYTRRDNAIFFTLQEPQQLSIEFDGDRLHNLHLFANPLEQETFSQSNDSVMYFGPGVHRPDDLPNNQFRIPSNTTVYLAPGAIVRGKLLIDKAENVRILGRGILDHPQRGIEITDSRHVTVEGITVLNPDHYTIFGGGSSDIAIRYLKSFSCKGWSDGIDLMCCRRVDVENVFVRNSDDCIALYNHRWNWYGGSSDISVKNAVLWADIAHPINIGGHGDGESADGEVMENVSFRNIDILEHDEDDRAYQGCMAIDCGDKNIVHNILFEDVRVENIQEGCLFYLKVRYNKKYDKAPGNGIDSIKFRNIQYTGVGENPSVIEGYDEQRIVSNVVFENVWINGQQMTDMDCFRINRYVTDIQLK